MNPAQFYRNKAQVEWPGASVYSRGRGWIKHQHPTNPNRFMYDTTVAAKWHYGGIYDQDHEIDTAWQLSAGAWDYEIIKNDFHCFVNDNVPVSYRYLDAASNHEVELTVNAVEWVNDENDSEGAASFSSVTPTIDDDKITWADIAAGWDIAIHAQPTRLTKWLTVDSLANLGSPTIGGTNIQLRFSLTMQKSSGLQVWVDGIQWNEQNNTWVETSEDVEFRNPSDGLPVFWFKYPLAWDDLHDHAAIIQRVRRTGANFYAEIEVPWSWLQNASYPIVIDPTVDEYVAASADDAHELDNNTGFSSTLASVRHSSDAQSFNRYNAGFFFTGVAVPKDATINAATYLEGYFPDTTWDSANFDAFTEAVDDAVNFSTDADVTGRTRGSNSASFSVTNNGVGYYGSSIDFSVPVNDVTSRAGWASGQDMVVLCDGKTTPDELGSFRAVDGALGNYAHLHVDYTSVSDLSITISDTSAYQFTGVRVVG
jgi:hypothetical protein